MKKGKNLFASFMAMCFLICTLSFFASAVEIEDKATTYKALETNPEILQLNTHENILDNDISLINEEEMKANHDAATAAYNSLMNSFYESQTIQQKSNKNEYTVNGITADGFHDAYAGAYINSNLELVVLLSENVTTNAKALSTSQHLISEAANDNNLIFSSTTYSYKYLVSLMDKIYQYIQSGRNGEDGFFISSYSLNDYENCIMVGLESTDSMCINAFKMTLGMSPVYRFIKASSIGLCADAGLNPGVGLSNGSAAFRAVKRESSRNLYGFVTAAHVANSTVYDADGYKIGLVHPDMWKRSGNLDATFVVTPNDTAYTTFGTQIYDTTRTLTSGIDVNLAQGSPVLKSGKETGATYGVITNASFSFTSTDFNTDFSDFYLAKYDSAGGDSGGIVVSTRTGTNWIAGVHHGHYKKDYFDPQLRNQSVFCKASNITREFNISLY